MSRSDPISSAFRRSSRSPASQLQFPPSSAVDADATSPATQIAHDRDDYLGETTLDVGRQTSTDEFELFVSCNPAPAMQQQFEHLRPEFIAVHDVGTSSSRKLLASLASVSGRPPQKLIIRRQGYGTPLATVHFVELPSAEGTRLRMYSTDCDTEPLWRQSLAHMLLAFSRLGVIMVGDLQSTEIAAVLARLKDGMARGPWHNDQLLLLPLGSASSLVNHGMELARGTKLNVRTTPQVAGATDAWSFISGSWNRLTDKSPTRGETVAALARLVAASGSSVQRGPTDAAPAMASVDTVSPCLPYPAALRPIASSSTLRHHAEPPARQPASSVQIVLSTEPAPWRDEPAVPGASPTALSQDISLTHPDVVELLRRYVRQISEIGGVIGCTVFDVGSGRRVAHAGSGPAATTLAAAGAQLVSTVLDTASAMNLGSATPEVAITLSNHHLLLRPMPRHAGLALHVLMDKVKANLTLVRLQVLRLDGLFEEPS